MRRWLALAALALAAGCFNPDKPTCSYVCADVDPRCPDDYECRADGYCHLIGTTDSCLFSDAAMAPDIAMTLPVDMGPDLASSLDLTSQSTD